MQSQDRLLFRLNTSTRPAQEFRFWFTRRYVKLLWTSLLKMLRNLEPQQIEPSTSPTAVPAIEAVQAANLAAQHKEVVEKADFETPYQESQVFPLGEDPILAVRVAIKQKDNRQILSILPDNGAGLELGLNKELVHSFCQLLSASSQKAEWQLDLNFGEAQDLISKRLWN